METLPWIEKYRPKKLNDVVQSQNLMDLFNNSIVNKDITHYLFYGPPGTGKTSAILAMGREIFREHFPLRVIEFNASDDRGINAVREKITNEAKKYVNELISEDGIKIPPYKIIILDEADSMTDEAQDALRVIIEQYSTVTRFCFICNYISKITDAIKSRCTAIYFKKLSNECMINKLKEIAIKESMILQNDIFNVIIDVSHGDMRKAIMLLQNAKYLYNFKKYKQKSFNDMNLKEFKLASLPITFKKKKDSNELNICDIYHIAATISMEKARKIIQNILGCNNVSEIIGLAKKIMAMGYPIDNILLQLNKSIPNVKELNYYQKALIIKYSGEIFLKIKDSANEYIQLVSYMTCVHGIKNQNPAYKLKIK